MTQRDIRSFMVIDPSILVGNGDLDELKLRFPGGGSGSRDSTDRLMGNALFHENRTIVTWLFETGYPKDALLTKESIVLHVSRTCSLGFFRFLIESGLEMGDEINTIFINFMERCRCPSKHYFGEESLNAVKFIVSKGGHFFVNRQGCSVFSHIFITKNTEIVRFAIDHVLEDQPECSRFALIEILQRGSAEDLRYLLNTKKMKIDLFEYYDYGVENFLGPPPTLFNLTLKLARFEMFKVFIDYGYFIPSEHLNMQNFHVPTAQVSDPAYIDYFASIGYDFNRHTNHRRMHLISAVFLGRCLIVDALLRNGADPYLTGEMGLNCIWYATYEYIMRFLVYKGIRISKTNRIEVATSVNAGSIQRLYRKFRVPYLTDVEKTCSFAVKMKDGGLKFIASRWIKKYYNEDEIQKMRVNHEMPEECFYAISECPDEITDMANAVVDSELV